jgi:hypothetical protein
MEAPIFGICHFESTSTNFNEIQMIYFIVEGRISLGGDSNTQNGESKGRRQAHREGENRPKKFKIGGKPTPNRGATFHM